MTSATTGVLVKKLFIVLFSVMVASYVYVFAFGDFKTCFDPQSRWFVLIGADFTTYFFLIGAWIAYKESSYMIAAILEFTMYILGSHVSIGYILIEFYKLSREESLKDPLYYVLARRKKRDVTGALSVAAARLIFLVLGVLLLGVQIYVIIIELSPAYPKYYTSCFPTFITDMWINIVMLSVWIAYKESSWTSAIYWIVSLVFFRGITVCAYVLRELSYLSPRQPASLIIFKNTNRFAAN